MGQKLGQHFLKNSQAIKKIVAKVSPQNNEVIVEIGPGRGELTYPLLARCQKVGARLIAIEKDRVLADRLSGVEVVVGDALKNLKSVVKSIGRAKYKIVGNIPYYITGNLLRLIGELELKPERTVLMVQKEVAQRMVGGKDKMNLLAAAVLIWTDVELAFSLPPTDFSPPPKVSSAVIVMKTKNKVSDNLESYYSFIKILFASPRKTIENNLIVGLKIERQEAEKMLSKLKIKPKLRPQNLGLEQISSLAKLVD